MTTYLANAVDVQAVESSSNGDYVRTGDGRALYAAGDGNLVTYSYVSGLNLNTALSGGFEPLPVLSNGVLTSVSFGATVSFSNPTSASGSLQFRIVEPSVPDTLSLSVSHAWSGASPTYPTSAFVTTLDAVALAGVPLSSIQLGTLRWTIGWLLSFPGAVGQVLTVDHVWLQVNATTVPNTLTAPVFSAGQSRFDLRKDWSVTG